MSEKQLTQEELAMASGGAQISISSQKAEAHEGLEGGSQAGAALGGDGKQHEPQVMDNGLTAIAGG